MKPKELLNYLSDLECELHQPDTRTNGDRLDELLHDNFVEIGRDGQMSNKAEIIAALADEGGHLTITAQDFAVHRVTTTTAVLTYQSARIGDDGEASHFARRSSLWVSTSRGWRLFFHQATPVPAFAIADND